MSSIGSDSRAEGTSGLLPGLFASRPAWNVVSLLSLLAAWAVAAWLIHSDYLPTPERVAVLMVEEAASGDLFINIGITLARVTAA